MKGKGGIAEESDTIKLGSRSFAVTGFTLDQIQLLIEVFEGVNLPLREGGWQASRKILVAALSDQIPEAELLALKVSAGQVMRAVKTIGFVSELFAPGEAGAPVDQASV